MHITVYCPQCGGRYQLKPELRGQKMRCPNAICRTVFEVRDEGDAATVAPPAVVAPPADEAPDKRNRRTTAPAEAKFKAGLIGEMVPLLAAEAAEEPSPSPEAAWQQEPPPVRRGVPSVPVQEMVELLPTEPPPDPVPVETPAWQTAPPPVREPPVKVVPPPRSSKATLPAVPRAETVVKPPPAPIVPPPAEPIPEWQMAPPVREAPAKTVEEKRQGDKEKAPFRRSSKDTLPVTPRVEAPPSPVELPPGQWEAPPVRRGVSEESEPASVEVTTPPEQAEEKIALPPRKRGKALWIMAALLLLVVGVGYWAVSSTTAIAQETEEKLAQKAKEEYDGGSFPAAARMYADLRKRYPESDKGPEYEFWEEFSRARGQVRALDVDAEPARLEFQAFLAKHDKGAFLRAYETDVAQTLNQLAGKFLPDDDAKVTAANVDKVDADVQSARHLQAEARKYGKHMESDELEKRMARASVSVAAARSLDRFLAQLAKAPPTWDAVNRLEREADGLGLTTHPRVAAGLAALKEKLLPDVYRSGGKNLPKPPSGDSAPTLLLAPRLDKGEARPPAAGVVFALARGVLYALDARDGQVLWAERVGIDTATLPVRVPRGEINRELVLVLSSDSNTLTARDVETGEALWFYALGQPCLGRPVLIGRRAFVATLDGTVHEIETVKGQVLGRYDLGLPLSGGGARQEGTPLLYFPAERGFVFVLDADQHKCVGVLQSGHPSGSLRGEPVLVGDGPPGNGAATAPRYLILSQADGLDAMKLRAYRLPVDKIAKVAPLQPEPRVRGWSWFPPHCDGEKLVLATDAGILGLFGINQYHNTDPPLFPLLPQELQLDGDDSQPGRAQVVHALEDDFWVLARGRLQHWRKGLTKDGIKVASKWALPLALGSPLHAGQVSDNQDTLFVVTQSPARQACLATAVDAATGKVRWQRQLGLNVQGQPRVVGGRVVALDQGGGLHVFDPETKHPHIVPRAGGERGGSALWLQPNADGSAAWAVIESALGKLSLRRYGLGDKPTDGQRREFNGVLGGTPALGTSCLVLPLADGSVVRHALTAGATHDDGPPWRAPHADSEALGHALWLGGDDFLLSDGSKGLQRFSLPGKVWKALGDKRELEHRIVAAPLMLASGQIIVADAAGNLLLLEGDKLKEVRRWPLSGKRTAGPFLRGDRVGVVLDRRELVWLDPAKSEPVWRWTLAKGDGIVGQPQEVGDSIVVADLSGRFVALDARTGTPRGPGYLLKASAAPAAAPVAFGAKRIFAPLTDGTALLLSREQLEKKDDKGP